CERQPDSVAVAAAERRIRRGDGVPDAAQRAGADSILVLTAPRAGLREEEDPLATAIIGQHVKAPRVVTEEERAAAQALLGRARSAMAAVDHYDQTTVDR